MWRRTRVEITPDDISSSRLHVRPTYCRSFKFVCNNPHTFLQQQIFRFTNLGCRRVCTNKLGVTQHLCESSFSTHSACVTSHPKSKREYNSDSSMVTCPALVSDANEVVGDVTSAFSSPTTDMSKDNVVPEPCGIGSGVYSLG